MQMVLPPGRLRNNGNVEVSPRERQRDRGGRGREKERERTCPHMLLGMGLAERLIEKNLRILTWEAKLTLSAVK